MKNHPITKSTIKTFVVIYPNMDQSLFTGLPQDLVQSVASHLNIHNIKCCVFVARMFFSYLDWEFLAKLFQLEAANKEDLFAKLQQKFPIWQHDSKTKKWASHSDLVRPDEFIYKGRTLETKKQDFGKKMGTYYAFRLTPSRNKFSVYVSGYGNFCNYSDSKEEYKPFKIGITNLSDQKSAFVVNGWGPFFSLIQKRNLRKSYDKYYYEHKSRTVFSGRRDDRYHLRHSKPFGYFNRNLGFTFSVKYNFYTGKMTCYIGEVGFKATKLEPFDVANSYFYVRMETNHTILIV